MASDERRALRRWNCPNVDFDEVGEGDQRLPFVALNEIVQCDQRSPSMESFACLSDFFIDGDRFLDLNDYITGRQECEVVRQQHLVSTVDEGGMPIA
jgi:hypothetical protein